MKLKFFWYAFWVGVFYDRQRRILYVCPLPCCVIVFDAWAKPDLHRQLDQIEHDIATMQRAMEKEGWL